MQELFKKYFSIIFLFLCLSDLWMLCDDGVLRYLTKPSILISLIAFYMVSAREVNKLFLVALVFAWFGDVFLMFQGDTFFILGLGSFLVMQLLYAMVFYRISNEMTFVKSLLATIVILPCMLLVYRLLGFAADDLHLPMIAYAFSIIVMLKMAIFMKTEESNYVLLLTGALCFFASDLVLAHSIFDPTISDIVKGQLSLLVMCLYTLSQYLIVKGLINDKLFTP